MSSTLTSSSTPAEIEAAYIDNASYEEDSSVAKAKAFITACRIILIIRPSRTGRGNALNLEYDLELVAAQQADAQRWLSANEEALGTANSSIKHPSFEYLR